MLEKAVSISFVIRLVTGKVGPFTYMESIGLGGVVETDELAPGGRVLDLVFRKFRLAFDKEKGDSARLAKFISKRNIHRDIEQLLEDISAPE